MKRPVGTVTSPREGTFSLVCVAGAVASPRRRRAGDKGSLLAQRIDIW